MALRQAVRINSISGLCLTVMFLMGWKLSKCTSYRDAEGNLAAMPVDADDYERLVPVYEELPVGVIYLGC